MRCLMTMEIGRLRERLGAVLPPWSVLVAAGVAAVALALPTRATTAEAARLAPARAAIVAPAPTIPRAAIVVAGGATPSLLSVGWSTPIAAPEAPMPLPTGPLPTGLSAVVGPVATGGAMGGIAAGFLIALTRAGIRPRPPTPIRQVELISRVERPG